MTPEGGVTAEGNVTADNSVTPDSIVTPESSVDWRYCRTPSDCHGDSPEQVDS